jgi:hypothetical protein
MNSAIPLRTDTISINTAPRNTNTSHRLPIHAFLLSNDLRNRIMEDLVTAYFFVNSTPLGERYFGSDQLSSSFDVEESL